MKNSPLHAKHLELEAKMADFGGWLMPIEYPGGGVLAEHTSVRDRVGLFDVSHLGKAKVTGDGAREFLNEMFTNDLKRIEDGKAQYTLLCNEDGGVVDDLIVYQNSVSDFFLIPNASNTSDVVAVLQSNAPAGITIENLHEKFGVLALQGPLSQDVLQKLGAEVSLDYMAFTKVMIAGCEVILCRTGYTGEHGYELVPRWEDAEKVWDALSREVKNSGGLVCGLGARDTLRTEMGYPLHGHELSLVITPVQASAGWAIGWKKSQFRGLKTLIAQREEKKVRVLRALKSLDRGIPRVGMKVMDSQGREIGEVTSGTFSPTLKAGIALALVDPSCEIGATLTIDVRGRISSAEVVSMPLVASRVR